MASVNHLGHPIDEVYQPDVPQTLEELLVCFLPARQQTIACGGARRIVAGRPFRRCTGGSEDLGIAICRLTKDWFGMPSQGFSRRRGPTGRFAATAPFWSSWPACSISAVRRVCLMRLRASTSRFTSRHPGMTKRPASCIPIGLTPICASRLENSPTVRSPIGTS